MRIAGYGPKKNIDYQRTFEVQNFYKIDLWNAWKVYFYIIYQLRGKSRFLSIGEEAIQGNRKRESRRLIALACGRFI